MANRPRMEGSRRHTSAVLFPTGPTGSSRRARGRGCSACTHARPDGEPLVENLPASSAGVAALVRRAAAGSGAWLAILDTTDRFDVLLLLVATDGAIRRFGRDGRRLRPNELLAPDS